MNPLAWILDSLKTHPEPAQLPDLEDATPLELAEARSRLATFAQVATELRRLVDQQLGEKLKGKKGFRYGEDIYRPTNGRGDNYVKDPAAWWELVVKGLQASPRPVELLAALVPLGVKVTGLPMLAAALSEDADELRTQYIANKTTTAPIEVKPLSESPLFLQDMEEGEIR